MYPTRRMIFVTAAGVPLALLAAVAQPGLWLVGVAWILLSLLLFALDALFAPATAGLSVTFHAPGAAGVGRRETASVDCAFAKSAPQAIELALAVGQKLALAPERQTCRVE